MLTALVQSSIVTGLCIVMVQQNILTAHQAIPIVIGTNIGTTLKGLLIPIGMTGTARPVAIANICFNAPGVLLLLPFLRPFSARRWLTFRMTPASALPGPSSYSTSD